MNPYRYERAQDRKAERVDSDAGVFRCDRCDSLWPEPSIIQDGHRLCRRDADPLSESERRIIAATAVNILDDFINTNLLDRATDPPTRAFAGVSSVTGIAPTTLTLARGGASGEIVLTGVNFTSSDNVTTNGSNITITEAYDSSTQITLTISAAGGATPGDYNLLFNSDTLTPRGILKVR